MRFPNLLLILALACCLAMGQTKPDKTLYERVGRYDAISAIVDEYLKGVRADPQLARFIGRGADSLKRARQLLKEQLCALTGGPCVYLGRDMKTAHGGLHINEADWAVSTKYMGAALDKAHVAGSEKSEFLALIESFKPQITESDAAKP